MATLLGAEAEEADRAVCQNPGSLPTQRQPARGQSDRGDQPDPARLGELLSDWRFEPLFLDGQTMGRKEGAAAYDASQRTSRDGLEKAE